MNCAFVGAAKAALAESASPRPSTVINSASLPTILQSGSRAVVVSLERSPGASVAIVLKTGRKAVLPASVISHSVQRVDEDA